jgi:isopenicillin N synthase-like dioxygenase
MGGFESMPTEGWAPDATVENLLAEGWASIQLAPAEAASLAEVISAARRFFALPVLQKMTCQIGPAIGYRPQGIEYSNSSERPDEMETFSTVASSDGGAFLVTEAQDLSRRSMVAFNLLEKRTERLVIALAEALTRKPSNGTLAGGLRYWSTLQINHSRPRHAQSQFINEEHEDGHLLTLAFSTSGGLEIRQKAHAFVSVPAAPDQMVVMPGRVASLMTNACLLPIYHQVRALRDCADRISILFFADLAPALCQPWVVGESNRQVDIGAFVKANPLRFGLPNCGAT